MSDKKLRIMINSNSPWTPSGYGMQVRQFLPKIAAEGYPTACIAFYGLEGGMVELDNILFYPKINNAYGDDAMVHHSKHYNPDVMFTLQDIWTLDPNALKELANRKVRYIPIVPIDHEPVPQGIYDRLRLAYRIVTYSPFGHRELKRLGMHSTYIPHSVDTTLLKPEKSKTEFKEKLGVGDDTFVFGMVAANKDNPPRKSFDVVMQSFREFHERHPKSLLYIHTLPDMQSGFPLKDYARSLGISDAVKYPDSYELMYNIDYASMSKIYNSFDVLLAPAQNEGFGVPIIEAMSCGVPVITTDFTAMRDLVEDGVTGYKLKKFDKRYTNLRSFVAQNNPRELLDYMERIYADDRKKMGKAGREFVEKEFDTQVVFDKYWKPFLAQLEHEIYD